MTLVLKQVRKCDGACCKASPRFPTPDGKSCVYLDFGGCRIQQGTEVCPKGQSSLYPEETNYEVFKRTCLNWPDNLPGRNTGNCCKQWIEDGN